MSAPALLLALAVLTGGPALDRVPPSPSVTALRGVASWYAAPRGTAAAGPALRAALGPSWRGTRVSVASGGSVVSVTLADWCLCRVGGSERLVDLPAGDFAALAPLGLGLAAAEVSW